MDLQDAFYGNAELTAMQEMVYHRKSTRSYTGEPVDEATIQKIISFSQKLKPLYPDLKCSCQIVGGDSVKCILPWTTPQMAALYGEACPGALVNVGFLYQQLDLYLQSLGLGACWLGMGRLDPKAELPPVEDGQEFAILLAFGWPKGAVLRESAEEFKRKSLGEISDRPDERLEPARLAPSSVNSQPWYFNHDKDQIHVYCAMSGVFRKKEPSRMNRIDIGIALAQLYVVNPETFRFFQTEKREEKAGYAYVGSVTL